MQDFLLDIVVKITAKPVTPKVGLTQRGPYERNLFVTTLTAKVFYYGLKTDFATQAANAISLLTRGAGAGWALATQIPPQAITNEATAIGAAGATLNASVHPHGTSTAITFEYGTTPALGTSIAATGSPSVANALTAFAYIIASGLVAATQYYFRVKVVAAPYTIYGGLKTFKTLAA
jgi:hypothetical protein